MLVAEVTLSVAVSTIIIVNVVEVTEAAVMVTGAAAAIIVFEVLET